MAYHQNPEIFDDLSNSHFVPYNFDTLSKKPMQNPSKRRQKHFESSTLEEETTCVSKLLLSGPTVENLLCMDQTFFPVDQSKNLLTSMVKLQKNYSKLAKKLKKQNKTMEKLNAESHKLNQKRHGLLSKLQVKVHVIKQKCNFCNWCIV